MTTDVSGQVDAFVTAGTLLRTARMAEGLSEREVADRLNLMPGYVAILERDDYQALRAPAFARGYVRSYCQLLGLDEAEVLQAFDEQRQGQQQEKKRVETKSLQLQRTGVGVVVGLVTLLLLVAGLWWWQGSGSAGAPGNLPEQAMPEGTP